MDASLADDQIPRTFDGITPANNFERRILSGTELVTPEAVALGHDVFRLFKFAARFNGDDSVAGDPTVADRYPPDRIWGLSIEKVAAHLARTAGDDFKVTTHSFSWVGVMNAIRERDKPSGTDDKIDVAPRLRDAAGSTLRAQRHSPTARAEAWSNFQMALRVLAPIFSGEVTRADLSA